MKPLKSILALVSILAMQYSSSQQVIPLYSGDIPNSKTAANEETIKKEGAREYIGKISIPTVTVFLPTRAKANGTAVVIFPGGGYWINSYTHEGTDLARKFNEWGITAFVIKYRIPDERTMPDPSIGPLQDAQQAMILVRTNAKKWNINPQRIGVLGFSAGGHLASTIGTHYKNALVDNPTSISMRPDFMILAYAVISTDTSISHAGSFDKLLGKQATAEQRLLFSNEKQITDDTPPAFLIHASDDDAVPVDNSIVFYQTLLKHKIKAELHVYEGGGHGFGMNNPSTTDQWMDRCKNWLASNGWLTKK